MAEAYRKGLAFVLAKSKAGVDFFQIQMAFPEFKQGQFNVNRIYGFNPPLIGMYLPQVSMINFDKHSLSKISEFVRKYRCKFKVSGLDVFFEERGKRVAWLRENFFGATSPELFEAIGTHIYNLKADQAQETTFKLELLPVERQEKK